MTSIVWMLDLDLSAPDHTTRSRRGQHLDPTVRRAPAGAGTPLIVDRPGLSIVGDGAWAAVKHGGRGRRGWKTRQLGVDGSGVIIAHALTDANVDDATPGTDLIEAVVGDIARVTADAAYDTVAFDESAGARAAPVVVPPATPATVSRRGPRSSARDRTIKQVKEIGRRRWKNASASQQQARVEHAFVRYTSIFRSARRARTPAGQVAEALVACNVLNQMTDLAGTARLVRHRSVRARGWGRGAGQNLFMQQRPAAMTMPGRYCKT